MNATTALDKARAAWGDPLPGWVRELADECDRIGLRKTAERLGISPAMVSLALHKKRGVRFVEAAVDTGYIGAPVTCPVLGAITHKQCLRDQAAGFTAANPLRVTLYRACRNGCPHYKEQA